MIETLIEEELEKEAKRYDIIEIETDYVGISFKDANIIEVKDI